MIQFEHVTKHYEGEETPVLKDFSMVIEDGEFVLLTGESGIGKSTCIRLLLKETGVTSGTIRILDQKLDEISAKQLPLYRRKLGVVFQESCLIPEQTVYRNVELARLIAGGRKRENRTVITSLFNLLGITRLYNRYPKELSGGEKQKVCLARALVNYPSILLADEPTGNLSPGESRELMRLLELVHRQGITVVVATHDKESAEGLAYREISLENAGGKENGQNAGYDAAGQ